MTRLRFLPLVAFAFFACTSVADNPTAPHDGDPLLVTASQSSSSPGDLVKMVPFKVKSVWWSTATGDPTPCTQFVGSIATFVEWEGTSTHLGRVTGSSTNCYMIEAGGSFVLLAHSTKALAANGDVLMAYGSAAEDGTAITVHPDLSFEIAPVYFVGGTGRFENAVGWYHLFGHSIQGGYSTFEGRISSVGSSK